MRRLLVTVTVAVLSAALGPALPAPAAPAAGLVWGGCPPPPPDIDYDPRMRCAAVRVPLDYRHPQGRQITVTISRVPAANPAKRRGILLSNPGGPGASGLIMPTFLAAALPAEVVDRYDLIGFDPRGVGASTPVTCGLADIPISLHPPYPAPDGSIARNLAFARATARSCAANAGAVLPHITTANTARDMDRIRAALGESRLSYLGYSYGTYLGAVYTSLFPQRTDRMILDSAVDPNRVWYDMWRTWGEAIALRLPDFTSWVAARDDVYHLGTNADAVQRGYVRLAAALDREPVVLPDLTIDGNVLRELTRRLLYDNGFFPDLAGFWQFLADPAAVPAPALSRRTVTPAAAVPAAGVPADNSLAVQLGIVCGDSAWPRNPADYARAVAADRRAWPLTAGMPANLWPCAAWPFQPVEPLVKVTGHGPRNVLILQNLRDPATSWRSGYGLRVALGGRAAFVTQDAGNHGVYPGVSAPCTATIATAFLVSGALPGRDRFCPPPTPDDDGVGAARAAGIRRPWLPVGPSGR